MKYRNATGGPIIVKGVGEVQHDGEFETDLPVKHRGVIRVDKAKPAKEEK